MGISGYLADWDRLRAHLLSHGPSVWEADKAWFHGDPFTGWNDSYVLNREAGERFLELRGQLPVGEADRAEQFLVTFCPWLANAGDFLPPMDLDVSPDVSPDWIYSAASPPEVRRRLSLLDDLDLTRIFALYYDQFLDGQQDRREFALRRQREMVEVYFMWAAALGQAAGKGWGLVVGIG